MEAQVQMKFKPALLVIGRPKQGKSSFCRMLLSDEQKEKHGVIKVRDGISIYESNRFKDIYGQTLNIIDTPGLQSKERIQPLFSQINKIIQEYQCTVVAIAYCFDMSQKTSHQLSFRFMELLREKYSRRKNLFFSVFSKFDIWGQEQKQEIEKAFHRNEIEFQTAEFKNTFSRNICWMSEPQTDVKRFKQKIASLMLRQRFLSQFQNLKEMLRDIKKKDKKALIVVGRMGHGKSAFCRMIANQSQKVKIKAEKNIESVTSLCSLYKSSQFKQIYNDDLYVIDTPGIDSKDATYLMVKQIDDLIFQEQLTVVGIGYVVDIHQRQKKQKGNNYIFTFFQTLRIKYEYKQNLSFCILSKWDKYYDEQQGNIEIFKQMQTQFEKVKFKDTWERKIFWLSEPSKDIERFYRKVNNSELRDLYQTQTSNLKLLLSSFWKNKQTLSFEAFYNHRQRFEEIHFFRMMQEYASFQYKKELFDLQFYVKKPPNLQKNTSLGAGTIVGAAAIGGTGIIMGSIIAVETAATVGASLLATVGGALVATAFIATGGFFLIGLVGYGIYKLLRQQRIEKLNKMLQANSKLVMERIIKETAQISRQYVYFKKAPYITSTKCFDSSDNTISVSVTNNGDKFYSRSPGPNQTHRFVFTCKVPTLESYQEFIERISKEFFNS